MAAVSHAALLCATSNAALLVYCDQAVLTADGALFTFTSRSIGIASSSRYVVVGVYTATTAGANISGVTIGGVNAPLITGTNTSTTNTRVAFYGLLVPAGTTATIEVTTSATSANCGIGIWSLYNLQSTTPVDADVGTTSVTSTTSTGGVAIGFGGNASAVATTTWGGLTEDFDTTVEAGNGASYTGASLSIIAGSSLAVTANRSAGTQTTLTVVSFR